MSDTSLLANWQLLDTAVDPGGVYLLGRVGLDAEGNLARLVLLRITFDQPVRAPELRWSTTVRGGVKGAVAARGGRDVTVVWLPGGTAAPRVVRSPDGRRFARARSLARLLRPSDRRGGPDGVDLIQDDAGRSVLAVTTLTAPRWPGRGRLILATATSTTTFVVRQRFSGPIGAPQLLKTSTGRLGLAVEDSGISGGGDCDAQGPPRIWATAREAGGVRFGRPRLLLRGRACYQPGHQLIAGPRGELALAWGTGHVNDFDGAEVWVSTSRTGGGFSAPARAGAEMVFLQAGYDRAGTLAIAATRPGLSPDGSGGFLTIDRGPVLQLRPASGAPGPFEPVASVPDALHATVGAASHPVVLFRSADGRLQLQTGRR